MTNAKYFEGTVNPSNEAAKNNLLKLTKILNSTCQRKILFSEEDFGNDGHEDEILYTIGPIKNLERVNSEIIKCALF
jgi:L-2,4-diaminobutyric acid acetyltransferase